MLRVIAGRFHPDLESSLADSIRSVKQAYPFAPLAVLVPSSTLQSRLKRYLAVEQGLSLLNVHLLTFHQLALRLGDEVRQESDHVRLPRIVDDLFFEQLTRHLVRYRLAGVDRLRHMGHSSGTWGALWATIRDLKDGGVDPVQAARALAEQCFEREDSAWLDSVFSLYAAVKEGGKTLEIGSPDDLAESLIPHVPASAFISSLHRAFYYGFYDLTQVQLSFCEAVWRTVPTELYFPLSEGQAFGFARRFHDRYLQSSLSIPTASEFNNTSVTVDRKPPAVSCRSTVGVEEELASTCRTILDLVETNGYHFEDIGVVARTLTAYQPYLRGIFDRYCIPFASVAGRPLMEEPLCKVLLQVASLRTTDFYRTTVLNVVTSPLHVSARRYEFSGPYRPEQWTILTQALHITHGLDEWKKLEQLDRSPIELGGEDREGAGGSFGIAPDVISLLWQVVSRLIGDCTALPTRGGVGVLVDALEGLARQHLLQPDPGEVGPESKIDVRLASVWTAVEKVWSDLRDLDTIGEEISWDEFVELLTHACERATIPLDDAPHQGVQVLDAMSARGLPFTALFVLGLNEKVFPRYIREDPFLRDRHRRVLDATLGFKIDEKLNGYAEEALLFELLCQSAGKRLYLSFQRADEAGRMVAPSPYLEEVKRRFRIADLACDAVPRRLSEQVTQRPSTRLFLPPSELVQWIAVSGQDPSELLQEVGLDAAAFRHSVRCLDEIEEESLSLTPFDGLTGGIDRHWSWVENHGIAPTPLERYARCPFQYFASDILRLEQVRQPLSQGPDAVLLGALCHAALRYSVEDLVQGGWPANGCSNERRAASVDQAMARAAVDCEVQLRTGPYLLWELAREHIAGLVSEALKREESAQEEEPFSPIAFEFDAEGVLMLDQDSALKLRGRLDRIDRHRDTGAIRIVDYKFTTGSGIKSEDRRLPQSAARGYRLQPPLYCRLSIPGQAPPSRVDFLFLAPQWASAIASSTFDASVWSSDTGALIQRTLTTLVEGIRAGRFFILPDSYCEHCDYHTACRRGHQATWWRAYRSLEGKTLKNLRLIRVSDD